MNFQEIIDFFNTLKNDYIFNAITIFISIINIITTLILSVVNIYFNQRNKRNENYRKAFLEYYFPIKNKLIEFENTEDLIYELHNISDKNYYELNYNQREVIVEKILKPYLEFYNSLPKYCLLSSVDNKIIKLNQYYATNIFILGKEGSLNISILKTNYPQCKLQEIISDIDTQVRRIFN